MHLLQKRRKNLRKRENKNVLKKKSKEKKQKKKIEKELVAEIQVRHEKKKRKPKVKPDWLKPKKKKNPDAILLRSSFRELDIIDKMNPNLPRLTHKEIKEILLNPNMKQNHVIIDLRDQIYEGEDLISGSKRIEGKNFGDKFPKQYLEKEFSYSELEWKSRFGFPKPSKNQPIIFVSGLGKRADAATKTAIAKGFTNAKSLYGGIRLFYKYYHELFKPTKNIDSEETNLLENGPQKTSSLPNNV